MQHDASDPPAEAVLLRDVTEADLPVLFEHQRDPEATRMAAFAARDREAFMEHWAKIIGDENVVKKAIVLGDRVAGNMVCFEQAGARLVGYWIGREFWGKGIATRALTQLLTEVEARPLQAYVAKQNVGSIRVLEKCGFVRSGEGSAPSSDGGDTVEELVFTLET